MNQDKQPEALRLAGVLREIKRIFIPPVANEFEAAAKELCTQHDRIAELESQLATAQQGVQPVAWLAEYVDREGNSKWYVSTHKDLATENDMYSEPKPLYTHPTQQGERP